MLVFVCAGCGAQNVTATETTTAEGTTEQKEEATATPEETTAPEPTEEPHVHNYTETITTEAACETDGLKTLTCECGDSYTETISATGHIYENYVFNEDATYLADGTETATCICGLTDTRTKEGSKLEYTYTDMSATMYAQQAVNVRDLPTTDGNKVNGLTTNQEVTVTGQCNETGWYRIVLSDDGSEAYVSNNYLSDSKVEVQASVSSEKKNWQDYYQDHVWYDMDRFFFIIVDSREEGGKIYGGATDYSMPQATLQERFPDEKVYLRFGCQLRDGHWMYFAYVRNSGLDPFIRPFE